jgi:hypothetical protein
MLDHNLTERPTSPGDDEGCDKMGGVDYKKDTDHHVDRRDDHHYPYWQPA